MSLVRLNIKGISYSQTQNGAYALILNEIDIFINALYKAKKTGRNQTAY